MDKKYAVHLLKDILPDVISTIAPRNIQDQIRLEKIWQEVAEGDAGKAVIVGTKEGVLFVRVESQAILFRMRMRKQSLLTKICQRGVEINNIVFKIGKAT